ncbi:efflux RND transporter periplasmic adaptor subunit [Halocola ammonii]
MKFKAITYIVLAAVLIACDQSPEDLRIEELTAKRDSLKEEKTELTEEIEKIEKLLAKKDTTEELTEVTSMSVSPSMFHHFFTVQASLEATKNAQVYPETQGRVIDIRKQEGDKLRKGDVIMELDTELIEKNIAEVQTNLDLAKDVFQRQKRLWDQNIGSEMQYLEAKNRKEQLENTLATLREQRNKALVRAPFSGVLDKIVPKIGEMANPAMPVARVVNLEDVYLTADISERYMGRIEVGDSVRVTFPEIDTVKTVITRIGNYIDPANRSFEITVQVPNKEKKLKPNMLAEVKINDYTLDSAITIPSSIIQQDTRGRKFVYTAKKEEDGYLVEKQFVEAGRYYEGQMVILSGLKAGDEVLDKGSRKVVDGQMVNILKDSKALVQK